MRVESTMTLQQQLAIQDQENKLATLLSYIDEGHKEVGIFGAAGVGKSHLCRQLIIELNNRYGKQRPQKILCSALAHQACGVMEMMLNGVDVEHEVKTLSSSLDHKKHVDSNGIETFKYKPKKILLNGRYITVPPSMAGCDILISDECSQLSEKTKDEIDSWVADNTIRIYLGDSCQLPPIDIREGELISKCFSIPHIELTIPFRYEGDIYDMVDTIRNEIKKGLKGEKFDKDIWKQFIAHKDKDYEFINDSVQFFDLMLTHNKDNTNPYHAKFISYHNYRHERVSKFIRDKINPHKFDFEPGDIIMATKTFNPTGVQNIIVNSEHGLIERKCKLTAYIVFVKVFGDLHYYEVTKGENEDEIRESYATALGQEVVVEPMDYFSIRLQDKKEWIPIQPLNIKRLKQIGQHIIDNGHFYDREDFENNKWKAYYDLFDFFAQIQYGYSSTAHKAQGSTYEVVFVHISDIISAKHMTDLQKLQAIYVALTRAKYKIYVFYDEKNT